MTESLMTLSQVIGQNVRNIRAEHTLEELASHGRALGTTWSAASISAIERGEFRATIEAVSMLALSLDQLRGEGTLKGEVTSRDLFQTDKPIALGKKLVTSTDHLLQFLGGDTSGTVLDTSHMMKNIQEGMREWVEGYERLNLPNDSMDLYFRVEESGPQTPAEHRLAKKVGIDVQELRTWAVHLWGKSFEDHRDDIAGPDATPQKKGRVSRELLNEIEIAMKDRSSGDD
ncbi:helix-turn-helix domain-containing protein [Corynebacterium gallinarum]|nr:helix-turn-helix transcriptional regulator [Corynebacterium gallinarum]